MMRKAKPEATLKEKIAFFSTITIGTIFVTKNFAKMRKYVQAYQQLRTIMNRNNVQDMVNVIGGAKESSLLMIETVSPKFTLNYFQNIEDSSKYTKRIGKFYEGLVFESGFEGKIRTYEKQYQIWFEMDKPTVGSEVALASRELDKRGMKLHASQLISVLGQLRYSKQMKRGVMRTKILCLDRIQMQKYWQMKIIATILSNFYFGVLLGVAISIYTQKNISELQELKVCLQKIISKLTGIIKEGIKLQNRSNKSTVQ